MTMGRAVTERDAAFTAFMEQAGPALLRLAWLLTGDHPGAQELTQAALVKTYMAWPRIREGEALAYTRRVLANHRTDSWRSTRREVLSATLPEGRRATGDHDVTDDRDEVVRLLRRLPEQQRKVVVLRYYADLSERATADVLGISVGAVKSAASQGLAALRSVVEPAGPQMDAGLGQAEPDQATPQAGYDGQRERSEQTTHPEQTEQTEEGSLR